MAQYRALLEKEVAAATHNLSGFSAFQKATADTLEPPAAEPAQPGPRRGSMSLCAFADQRRA